MPLQEGSIRSSGEKPGAAPRNIPLAIVLEGVPERWQMNVLQILGRETVAEVQVDGYGVISAPAFVLDERQARQLAAQIIEAFGLDAFAPSLTGGSLATRL